MDHSTPVYGSGRHRRCMESFTWPPTTNYSQHGWTVLPAWRERMGRRVIFPQASSLGPLWRQVWKSVITGPDADFRLLLVLGDLTILVTAATFLTWELGVFPYDDTGAGFLMGAVTFVFIGESITTYRKAVVVFVNETFHSLK